MSAGPKLKNATCTPRGRADKHPVRYICRAVNVPTQLLHVLEEQKQQSGKEALLIHLSTDQVGVGSTQESCMNRTPSLPQVQSQAQRAALLQLLVLGKGLSEMRAGAWHVPPGV